MNYIDVTQDNLDQEHICCAISNSNDIQVSSKKAWMQERFKDGLKFIKSAERGKCFIEYIPAENAWVPINAEGFLYIDCLWVSGSMKGHGYSSDLLKRCMADAAKQEKNGICILSSKKKRAFLADPQWLAHKGFAVCDEADNGIQLWCLPMDKNKDLPKFKEKAKHPHVDEKGYVLYYTDQCPFNAKYVPIVKDLADQNNVPFHAIHLQRKKEAQNAPTPVTSYALFLDGKYVTNEILSDKKFLKMIEK
jgi:predicted GNAT family acetyltransferase